MTAISRLAAAIALSGGLSLTGLATAQADPAFGPSYSGGNCPPGITCTHWCPGDDLYSWSNLIAWDWNVCHDWYWNSEGVVDVNANWIYPWHGAPHQAPPPPPLPAGPPPPLPPRPAHCPPWNVIIGPSECGGL